MNKFSTGIFFFLSVAFLLLFANFSQKSTKFKFNKDAGYIPSFTEIANLKVSSNSKDAQKILDKNEQTAWQSDAPLPNNFIDKKHQNLLLNKGNQFFKKKENINFSKLTDGDLSSSIFVENKFKIEFNQPKKLHSISLKFAVKEDLKLQFFHKNGALILEKGFTQNSNYQLQRIDLESVVSNISFSSKNKFTLFELAALENLPKEFAIFDFQQNLPIGQIHTKHWAGDDAAKSVQVYLSSDQKRWQKVGALNPESVHSFILNLEEEISARYLKIEYELFAKNWNKCFLWEVNVYDKNGKYGEKPVAQPSSVSLSELLGVNGYWGWGHKAYSSSLKKGEGVDLYAPISSHFRNYHDMTWDLTYPDQKMDFEKMAKNLGTPAKDWLNWDREYPTWTRNGQHIQTSLQFFRFKDSDWKNPYESAFDYAHKFVKHYGATQGNGLICSIEAGNEPWQYDAEIYKSILFGMAKGAKKADPTMEVFPCALQAADPTVETQGPFKNYIGARISKAVLPYLDGINVHAYSYVTDFWGRRKAVFPEHQNSTFWEVLNAIRWRDANIPGKKIYLSEWGFDAAGGGENCTHSECISEEAAAVYGFRNLLIASRLGMDRATWYFYGNTEFPSSLYTRSGLTGSKRSNFQKKKVFYTFEQLLETLGDKYFLGIYQENEDFWAYHFGKPNGEKTHLIIWQPIAYENLKTIKVQLNLAKKAKNIYSIFQKNQKINFQKIGEKTIEFLIENQPVIIEY